MDSGGGTGTGTGTPLLLHRNATLVLGASAPLVVRLMMLLDGFSFLFTASFNSLCIFAALAWIIYRAFQVLNKPLDELVSLLGFEIPVGPTIDLADIKANGVVIHWKPADDRRSTHKHEVQVNGRIVGDVSHSETSIVISGLQPEHFYVIRLIVVNAQDFRSPSEPIRIFTKPAESGDFFSTAAASSTSDDEEIPPEQSAIVIRPLKAFPDVLPLPTVAPPMVREVSNGPGQPRRSVSTAARRPSPAVLGIDTQQPVPEESNEPPVPEESQQQLAKRFDDTGREIREVEKQLQEEEQEAVATKAELLKERDEARADLKKKEENTRKLRKEVNALERDNAAAHSKRVAQERILNEKRNERQKLKDDTALWEKDAQEMEEEMTRLEADKKAFLEHAAKEKAALQEKHAQELGMLKAVEEENRERSSQIKALERDKNNSPVNAENAEPNDALIVQEAEEDRYWNERMSGMAEDYRNAFQALDAARQHYAMVSQEMAGLRQRQAELVQMPPAPPPFEQTISRASSLRQQRRTPSGPVTTNASSSSGFPVTSAPSFSNGIPNLSPSFPPSTSPFFNYSNGMTVLPRQPMDQGGSGMSSADVEALTAGAPLSPGVGAELLPAGLLSNVDEDSPPSLQPSAEFRSRASDDGSSEGRHASNANILPGLGPIPGLGMIPGLGAPQTLEMAPPPGPTSPGSASSRSPSVFASPQASTNNLTFSPQNILDSDRQSIRSIRSNRAASGSAAQSGSRFTQILGLDKFANRPRGKTMSEEGPTLGTLSKTQSQSMPRGTPEETETGSPGIGRRRNSSHSGNFFGSILNRNASTRSSGAESSANKNIAVRRRAYNMFGGTKLDGWPAILGGDRPASPRPGSTHSIELPRPSQDSTNWGFGPWNEPFGQRSSPLSADWGMPQPNPIGPSRTWGSRHPSRRPSTQHGASGVAYDIMEDDVDDPDILPPNPPAQAPIGTKPAQPKESPQPAKLNPTAKSFSLFSRGSDKKAKNKDKDTSVAEEASSSRTTPITVTEDTATPTSPPLRGPEYDFSPPQSRKSRDTRSVTTADSSLHEYSSRTSLDRSASYTPSEAQTPSSASGKETFMQKLTRKSSSGKFGLPVFNRDKKQRFKGSENEGAVGEEGEGEMNTSVGSLATPGREEGRDRRDKEKREGRSWSSVFTGKMGKKDKANETPSLSGASLASETEEGWDE